MKTWLSGMIVVLGACAAQDPAADKSARALAPVPADEVAKPDDKADGAGTVVLGATVKVGEKGQAELTRRRGWIAHPVELVGGQQVDITAGGDGQDTMFWVYGPRDANGYYPAQPIGFNDDETPGEVVSSRLYLTVPADGTYLVLVSTWDNFQAYPENVSRGTYQVRVACASGGFGACGPAVSYEGEACWANTDCRAENAAQGAHCEGEIVCPPGTQCIWAHEGICRDDYVVLSYAPRQCGSNPWQRVTPVGDGVDGATPEGELTTIDRYFEDQGIDLLEVGLVGRAEPMATCQACSCARGDLLVVKARAHQAAKLESQFGFTRLGNEVAAQLSPKQCGQNPWPDPGVPAGSPEEAQAIGQWTASFGAPLAWVGYLYATTQRYVCRACSCPRGDLLFALPKAAADLEKLQSNGFSPLYLP